MAWSQQSDDKDHNNWSEFHRTNMTRWNPYEKVLNVHDVGNLLVKWSSTTGASIDSSPAVMKGVVYIGSNDGKVYALNAKTGAELWSFTTGGYAIPSPAVANGVVYAGSYDYNVYALNAKTGAKLWNYTDRRRCVLFAGRGEWGRLRRLRLP